MPRTIEFWYEFASTYSYPAAMRVADVAAALDIQVIWQPFLLGPIFNDLGWRTSPFKLQPAKGAYMWRDMARICDKAGLPFSRPDPFPQNGLLAARIALALPDDGTRAAFSRAVYMLQFGQGASIADPKMLERLLFDQGVDAPAAMKLAQSDANKGALKHQTDTARAHGLFGAPTWRTPDGEIFWGNDRLEDALDWVSRSG